jgi:hypothetical protein
LTRLQRGAKQVCGLHQRIPLLAEDRVIGIANARNKRHSALKS